MPFLFLATTENIKLFNDIISLSNIWFKRITVKDAKEHLAEVATNQGITYEDDALHIIAQKADGAMRDVCHFWQSRFLLRY
jgi:DNA polymerase-3 subunit gamma/tau